MKMAIKLALMALLLSLISGCGLVNDYLTPLSKPDVYNVTFNETTGEAKVYAYVRPEYEPLRYDLKTWVVENGQKIYGRLGFHEGEGQFNIYFDNIDVKGKKVFFKATVTSKTGDDTTDIFSVLNGITTVEPWQ